MKYQSQIWNHVRGNVNTSVLKCSISLGIFDAIHDSGKSMLTLTELSNSLSSSNMIKTHNLYRVLRYLTHMNLITITSIQGNDHFSLTHLSKLLLGNQEKSLKDWAIGIGDVNFVATWHEMSSSCSKLPGELTAWEKVHGKEGYELNVENPEFVEIFNKAMSSDTTLAMPAFIQGCDEIMSGISSLVDVGGGIGTAMTYVVKAFPHIKCTVFDLPHVIQTAADPEKCHGIEFIGGDLFSFIPPADAIFLKDIFHYKTMEIQMEDEELEMKYQSQIWNHVRGNVNTSVLKCSISLGIFDAIHDSGKSMLTLTELSNSLSSPNMIKTHNLYRLLRYLTHMNLITITSIQGNDHFSLTHLSKLLLGNQEKSLKDWAIGIGDVNFVATWHEMSSSCSKLPGELTAWEKVHGKEGYELNVEDPEFSEMFDKAMSSDTTLAMPAFIQGCDKIMSGISSLVDVGGGIGTAMTYVVKAFPHIKCTVFDLPHVIQTAADPEKCHGIEFIGGDLFSFIPPADAIFLKAIPADKGKVIIMDIVLDENVDNDDLVQAKLSMDLDMMSSGGRERTKEDWKNLLEMSGFTSHEIIPILAIQSIIVAYP
ncbi:hypothetical protein MKW92_052137 [Papaver armeniacum]|nr:hypothetical protein MKW92_052137 [Papaver armeniacum]